MNWHIYKYPLAVSIENTLSLPRFSHILDIQLQCGVPHVWVKVSDCEVMIITKIKAFPTGANQPEIENLIHIKTIQDAQGYVWHFFYSE